MNLPALAAPALTTLVLAAVGGCSASGSASTAATAGASQTAVSASPAARAAAAPATASAAGPQHCPSTALRVRTTPGSGEAMDGVYWDLTFINTGTTACTLYGYPGLSFLTAARSALTAPAGRAAASRLQVTLAPGQTASAQVKTPNVGNLPAAACRQAVAKSLEVYPPNDTAPVFVPASISVCAGRSPGGSVWPVQAGDHAGV